MPPCADEVEQSGFLDAATGYVTFQWLGLESGEARLQLAVDDGQDVVADGGRLRFLGTSGEREHRRDHDGPDPHAVPRRNG